MQQHAFILCPPCISGPVLSGNYSYTSDMHIARGYMDVVFAKLRFGVDDTSILYQLL